VTDEKPKRIYCTDDDGRRYFTDIPPGETDTTKVPPWRPVEDEKPLHVRVAEALGTLHVLGPSIGKTEDGRDIRRCTLHETETFAYDFVTDHDGRVLALHYDTDWSATGPLIERYSLDLYRKAGDAPWSAGVWIPNDNPKEHLVAAGETPLLAVCNLILALAAGGKLKEVPR
jgi:hypothetical protein